MTQMLDLPVRKDGSTHGEFAERRQTNHAEPATALPGLPPSTTSVTWELRRCRQRRRSGTAYRRRGGAERSRWVGGRGDTAEFIHTVAGPTLTVEETVQLDESHD